MPIIETILTAILTFIFSGWAVAVLMLVLLPRRQSIDTARVWLLLIFFMPWLGILLYLFIGETRLPANRYEKHKLVTAMLKDSAKEFKQKNRQHRSQLAPKVNRELAQTISMAENLGFLPVMGGNAVELVPGYDEIIERIIADIDRAQRHVHLLYYIIADDETGRRMAGALERAVKRGVTCRVLVDDFGALPFIKKLDQQIAAQGIEIHRILPISLFRRHLSRIDLRNHRKIVVIDGQVAYTGSQNVVNADYGYDIEGLTYEELMVRLTGPIVLQLQAIFTEDWFLETGQKLLGPEIFPTPSVTGSVAAQAVPSGPIFKTENFHQIVVALLYHAKERVVITTPYFIPDDSLLQAMHTAVLSGVNVTLIVSGKVDQVIVGLAQSSYYDELLAAGVNVFIYGHALLHAKHMSVDNDIALIGSGNMDQRSFDLNFEISMLFYSAEVTQALRSEESKYIERAEELLPETWAQRPARQKFLENTAKLVSPLL